MNAIVEQINSGGYAFVEFAASMLIQASVLIVLLFLADFALRKRVRAVFRYWMWLLVLVKLVLPTSLSGPFSIGYWFGDKLEYADVGRGAYEPRAAGPMMPALPYIDTSNVPPAIYRPATSPAPGEVDVSTAQSIAAPAVPPAQIEWQGIVFVVWLALAMAMALLLAQRAIFVDGLVAQAREASRPMYDALEECRRNMKVRGKVGLKVSPNAASPAVCGLLRPVILVPQNLASALDTTDLRIVLLHELAHVKRGDLWVNLAQTLLQIVYFYNPLLWLANAVIRRAREQAVDEAVLVAMGERASRYPETLVSVAKLAFKRPALSLRLIGVVESKSALTARIKRILSRPIPKSAKLGILGLAVIVITAAILLPMAKARPYTDRARQVMALAEQEARRLKHEYIGTEHILLALSRQDEGVGGQVLQKLGIRTETVEGELAKLVKAGSRPVTKARLPQTPRARSAIDYAEQEAKALDHDYIGTEHILLGLMRETDGLAAQIVTNLGVSYEVVREEVLGFVKPGANASLDDAGERDQRATPITSAYEKAEGSMNLKIKVGPSTFKVNMVVRWDGGGNPRFEDGLGNEPREIDLKTPDYSKQAAWMDIANIYISPDSARYDVLELRVFDHKTRELLSPKGRIGIGCDVKNSIVQLRSIGAPLPESVDVWVRLLHNPENDSVWRLDAKAGASAQLNREQISLRMVKDGLWSHSTKQPAGDKPGQIQWTKRHEDSDVCMAVFDFTNVKRSWFGRGEKYQICAVGVDGKRYVPDFPHFIGVVSGATEIIRFDLPAEKVSRFEIRPFHGRDRFYFDNIRLPRIGQRTFDPPPIVTARVNGTRTEFSSSVLDPIRANIRVLPGIAAASAQGGSGTLAARVYPIHEPKNLDTQTTVIYDIHGIQLNRCFLCYLDGQGNRVSPQPTIDISQSAPARQFTGFETVPIPIENIGQICLCLVENDPRPTQTIRPAEKRVATELIGRVVDGQGEPIAGAQVGLSTGDIGVGMSNGRLEPIRKKSETRIAETDSKGVFDMGEHPDGDFDLIVVCDEGFAFVESKEFGASHEIRIRSWGRIEGQLAPGREASGNRIWMASLPNYTMLPHRWQLMDEGICNGDGRFVFEKVPAGWFEVGFLVRTGRSGSSITCRTPVEVVAGQTSKMTLGGTGRLVVGKFMPPTDYDEPIPFDEGLRSLVTARPKQPRPDNYEQMTKEQQHRWYLEWRKTDEYQDYLNAGWRNNDWRQYTFRINEDGSFRIEDVIAGKYEMDVSIERLPGGSPGEEIGGYYGAVEVPPIPGGRSDEPLDLGMLDLHIVDEKPPDKTASTQPAYSATLANGVTVELVGICEHPSEGKQWWGVDGQPIAKPYERLNYNERSADSKLYEVAYRLFGWDDILSTIYSNSEITGHISLYPLSQKTEKLNIPDAANAYGAILLVKPDAQSIQLEMGIGRDSDWKTLCTQASPVDKTGTGGPGVVFQPAIEKDGKTHITIAHQIKDRQIRVIAVDHSGQIHKSEGFLNTISGELGSCQVRFNLPADQIKEIQFQTQKFERVTFKNIALQPSFKTNVQTEVETPDEKAGVVWGEVVGGLRAAAEFVPEKESYTLGEGVEVRFHIQNVGSEDAQFASESTRQDWATVKDSDGNDVKVDRRWHSGTVATIRHIIKPGQILTLKTSGLGFGDFDDPAVVVERKGPWIGSVVRCGPGQYSISYPVNRDLETGVRKVTVTERQQVDPRRFELVLDRQSMLQAVNELMQKYRVRICFEEIGSESGAQQDQLSGAFSGPTIPELLDKLTAAGPYKWEKFYRTYVVYPKEGSVLSFFVKTDISDSPLEDVAKAILDQDPNGKNIEIEAAYKGKMRDHLWISKSSAMYALAKATESAGYNDVVWSVAEDQGRRILSLHKLGQAGQRAVKVESSQAASLPNNLAGSQGNTDEVKYQGRTIAEWMSQWDTRVSDDIDAATNALIKIGRPAVPRMIEEINKRSNYGWHAVGVLTKMGPEAEEAIPWLIEAALDKDLRFGDGRQSTTAYRGSVLYSLSRMTWARDRVIPVLQKVAEDSEEVAGVRRQVILALRDVGKGAMPILQKLTETEEHSVRDAAHGAIGQLLEKEEGLSKDDYYTPLIERDPFDPSVLQYLGNAKGIVNYGRPHPLTQNIKKLYRERLAKQTDPQLAWRLASIIQNGLKNTELMWAAPADGSKVRWPREDPTENYTTLAEVLQLGFDHAESGSQLQRQFGISLAKLRLLQGDWDRMNAMLKELGQEQIPKESRQWLHAPPVDWEEGVGSQWKIADESMRSGNCGLEFRIEKDGKGLQGVHFLVKRAPESTNVIQTGISIDTLFFEPYPLKGFSSFGYKAADRPMTRYAVSDESGIVRFEKLPNIPIKIEVLVPTSNFPEAVSNWDLWMEVEPGKYKIAKKYGAGAVNTQEPPAVAKLKEGQTVHYPNLVVRVEGEVAWGEAVEGEGRSVVRANVLDHQGRPVEGATVELQLFAGGDVGDQDKYSIRRAMTDANGFYVFEDIRAISGHIGRAFTSEDDSGGGVPFGLGFRFEIEPGKDYDITLGGKGRPVTGRLVPASGNNGDIDWSKAWVGFELRTAPMGMIELDSQRRTAMTNVEGGDFYDKRPVKINPDGTFRIENVRAGRYMLRVKIPEEPKRDGFNLFRDVRIPLMPNGTTEKPFNLGSLAVSHGSHTAPRHIDNLFLGSLVFDRDIAVELVAGNEEQPDVVAAKGIRFAKNGESVTAALNVEWKSLVVDKWRARLALLGGNGSHLAWDDAFIETSKTIEKYPQLVEETLSFSFSPEPDLSRISRFTITIQPLDEVLAGPVQVEGEKPDNESNLVWGDAVNGLRAAVEFVPEKQAYSGPVIIDLRLHIQNVSDHPIQFTSSDPAYSRAVVEDDKGNKQRLAASVFSYWRIFQRCYLQPGGELVLKSGPLGIATDYNEAEGLGVPWVLQNKPGVYFACFAFHLSRQGPQNTQGRPGSSDPFSTLPLSDEDWKGMLETGRHKLVVAVDPNSGNRPR